MIPTIDPHRGAKKMEIRDAAVYGLFRPLFWPLSDRLDTFVVPGKPDRAVKATGILQYRPNHRPHRIEMAGGMLGDGHLHD
jgi:hypothetical protein